MIEPTILAAIILWVAAGHLLKHIDTVEGYQPSFHGMLRDLAWLATAVALVLCGVRSFLRSLE